MHHNNQSRQGESEEREESEAKGGRQKTSKTETRRGNKNREEGKPLGESLGGSVASARMYTNATRCDNVPKKATVKPWHLHEALRDRRRKEGSVVGRMAAKHCNQATCCSTCPPASAARFFIYSSKEVTDPPPSLPDAPPVPLPPQSSLLLFSIPSLIESKPPPKPSLRSMGFP